MRLREFLKSKINRAVITEKRLKYLGSIGVDSDILKRAGILGDEKVHVLNYNNGMRFQTYVIEEEAGSDKVVLYGPAARSGEVGDEVCILSYCLLSDDEITGNKPIVVDLGENS
ncbi:MAG: aspartate 1-decarboxylase [Candidatus Kaelpia imicola]|nr:aspartate 1-decarboxylase [Candidatus Kaelpia imicola]